MEEVIQYLYILLYLVKMHGETVDNSLLFGSLFMQFQRSESVKETLFENTILKRSRVLKYLFLIIGSTQFRKFCWCIIK